MSAEPQSHPEAKPTDGGSAEVINLPVNTNKVPEKGKGQFSPPYPDAIWPV